jgi:hypothetical protein
MALGISNDKWIGMDGYELASESGEEIFTSLALISDQKWGLRSFSNRL